ncbi:MAG: glycosyltransferase family 4 protein [Phycisphaerae bacterium]|nr:glycosyltransferase family 4 protein [Phycisphaerae bacterium]
MKICMLSLNSYNVLSSGNGAQHVGGAETQVVAVGEGLARRGHDVSFICLDHGQPDGIRMPSGIRVFRSSAADAGLPGIRFLWPSITSVWSAIGRADPDVCLQACSDSWTGVAAAWCRRHKRKFIFIIMSNADCNVQLPFLKTRRERILCRYGLRRSDGIIAQTEVQRDMLWRNYGFQSSVVRPCSKAAGSESLVRQESENPAAEVLWVGRFSPEKRLEWFLDISEKVPSLTFHVVGGANSETRYCKSLESRATALPNVVMHGYVPHDEMTRVYRSCGILVSTSHCEGFPTTFIEAWAHGVPTVTSFDPDGIVAKHQLGYVGENVDELAAGISRLADHSDEYKTASLNARSFYKRNHDADTVAASFERVIVQTTL